MTVKSDELGGRASGAALWDQRYAEPGFAYGTAPNDFLREVEGRIPTGGPVLCLAEGEGRNAVFLAELGHPVKAVDLSAVGLEKAQRLATERQVRLTTEVADLASFVIEKGRWAAIVAIWMHVPRPLRAKIHAAAQQGLMPSGVLVIEAYTPAQLALGTGGPRDASLLVEPEELRAELDGLELEIFEAKTREVHEGRYHEGPSAVIQVLARKPR